MPLLHDMGMSAPGLIQSGLAQTLALLLESQGIQHTHWELVATALYLDGNAIAAQGVQGLAGEKVPNLVKQCAQSSTPPASISVVLDLTGLSFHEEQDLAKRLAEAGGILCERSHLEGFHQVVQENREAILEAARFTPAEFPKGSVPNGPPPAELYSAQYLNDQQFEAFRQALATEDDSSSIAN